MPKPLVVIQPKYAKDILCIKVNTSTTCFEKETKINAHEDHKS